MVIRQDKQLLTSREVAEILQLVIINICHRNQEEE